MRGNAVGVTEHPHHIVLGVAELVGDIRKRQRGIVLGVDVVFYHVGNGGTLVPVGSGEQKLAEDPVHMGIEQKGIGFVVFEEVLDTFHQIDDLGGVTA